MTVMIPVDENRREICPSFGRTPCFLLWDPATDETRYVDNPAAQAQSGAGTQAAQFVVDQGADVLLTPRCGENAARVLQLAGIRICKTQGLDAGENLAAFREGRLEDLTHFHAGFHGIQ